MVMRSGYPGSSAGKRDGHAPVSSVVLGHVRICPVEELMLMGEPVLLQCPPDCLAHLPCSLVRILPPREPHLSDYFVDLLDNPFDDLGGRLGSILAEDLGQGADPLLRQQPCGPRRALPISFAPPPGFILPIGSDEIPCGIEQALEELDAVRRRGGLRSEE